ncbi:MAG: hypothetical protein AAGM36_14365 [Cyanobacteria bacterium J06597_1]
MNESLIVAGKFAPAQFFGRVNYQATYRFSTTAIHVGLQVTQHQQPYSAAPPR